MSNAITQDPTIEVDSTSTDTEDTTEPTIGDNPDPTPEPEGTSESPSHEAAKYRHRLRDSEAQVEQLQTQVAALQKQVIHANIGDIKPSAWDLVNPDPSVLIAEDGSIDFGKLRDAIAEVENTFGVQHAKPVAMRPDFTQGAVPTSTHRPDFKDAFDYKQTAR